MKEVEEAKGEAAATADRESRIKTTRECCIIATRVNSVVSRASGDLDEG